MADTRGCMLLLRESQHALTPKERSVARYILANPNNVVNMNIGVLARQCGVSIASVVRFCKDLGFSGYKELIRNLYIDLNGDREQTAFDDIHPGDGPMDIMRNVCQISEKAIEDTLSINSADALNAAVDLLCGAKRIDFYGVGSSGFVALDAASKFVRTGKTCIAQSDLHAQVLTALTLSPQDAAVLISYSGDTDDMIKLVEAIRPLGVKIISITRLGRNPIADAADIKLYSSSTETLLRSGAMSSRIAQLIVVDTLYASVCSRVFDDVRPHLEMTRAATMSLHVLSDREEPRIFGL